MSGHSNTNDNSSATDKENSKHNYLPSLDLTEIDAMEKLGAKGSSVMMSMLYRIIQNMSNKYNKPYCWASVDFFLRRLKMSASTVERMINFLIEKKLVYRNDWEFKGGTKRHLVPRTKYLDYLQTYMSRSSIPPEVKKEYEDFWNPPTNIDIQDNSTIHQNEGCIDAPVKMKDALLLRNNINKKTKAKEHTQTPLASPSFDSSNKPPHGKSLSNMLEAGPPKTEQEITTQKLVIHFQDKPEALIKEYVLQNWERLKEKNNPVAYGVKAIQGGALERTKEKGLEIATATNEERRIMKNKEKAKCIYDSLKEFKEFGVFIDSFVIRFNFSTTEIPSYITIAYNEKDFDQRIATNVNRAYKIVNPKEQDR